MPSQRGERKHTQNQNSRSARSARSARRQSIPLSSTRSSAKGTRTSPRSSAKGRRTSPRSSAKGTPLSAVEEESTSSEVEEVEESHVLEWAPMPEYKVRDNDELLENIKSRAHILETVPSTGMTAAQQAFWLNTRLTGGKDKICSIGEEASSQRSMLQTALNGKDATPMNQVFQKFDTWSEGGSNTIDFLRQNIRTYCTGCFVATYKVDDVLGRQPDEENTEQYYFKNTFKNGTWLTGLSLIQDIILIGTKDKTEKILFRLYRSWQESKYGIPHTEDFECQHVLIVYKTFSQPYFHLMPEKDSGILNSLASSAPFVGTTLTTPLDSFPKIAIPGGYTDFIDDKYAIEFVNQIRQDYKQLQTNVWYISGTKMGIFVRMTRIPEKKDETNNMTLEYLRFVQKLYKTFWNLSVQYFKENVVKINSENRNMTYEPPLLYTYARVMESGERSGVQSVQTNTVVLWVVDDQPKYKKHIYNGKYSNIVCDPTLDNTEDVKDFHIIHGSIVEQIQSLDVSPFSSENISFEQIRVGEGNTPVRLSSLPSSPTTQPRVTPAPRVQGQQQNNSYLYDLTLNHEQIKASNKLYAKYKNEIVNCSDVRSIDPHGLFTVYYGIEYYVSRSGRQANVLTQTMKNAIESITTDQEKFENIMAILYGSIKRYISPVQIKEKLRGVFSSKTWSSLQQNLTMLKPAEFKIIAEVIFHHATEYNIIFLVQKKDTTLGDSIVLEGDEFVGRSKYFDEKEKTAFISLQRNNGLWKLALCNTHDPYEKEISEVCRATLEPNSKLFPPTVQSLCTILANLNTRLTEKIDPTYSDGDRLQSILQRAYNLMKPSSIDGLDKELRDVVLQSKFRSDLETEPHIEVDSDVHAITPLFYVYSTSKNDKLLEEAVQLRKDGKPLGNTFKILMTDIDILASALNINVCVQAKFKRMGGEPAMYTRVFDFHRNARANVVLEFKNSGSRFIIIGSNGHILKPIDGIRVIGYESLWLRSRLPYWMSKHIYKNPTQGRPWTHIKKTLHPIDTILTFPALAMGSAAYTSEYKYRQEILYAALLSLLVFFIKFTYNWATSSDYKPSKLIQDAVSKEKLEKLIRDKHTEKLRNKTEMIGTKEADAVMESKRQRELAAMRQENEKLQIRLDGNYIRQKNTVDVMKLREDLTVPPSKSVVTNLCEKMQPLGIFVKAVIVGGGLALVISDVVYDWLGIWKHVVSAYQTYGFYTLMGAFAFVIMGIVYKWYSNQAREPAKPTKETNKVIAKIDDVLEKQTDTLRGIKEQNLRALRMILQKTAGQHYFVAPELVPNDITNYVNGGTPNNTLEEFGGVRLE